MKKYVSILLLLAVLFACLSHSLHKQKPELLIDRLTKEFIQVSDMADGNDIRLVHMQAGSFSKNNADELFATFQLCNTPHTGGLDSKVIALFSNNLKCLSYQMLPGDSVDIYHLSALNSKNYLLVSMISVNQGIETQTLAMYQITESRFKNISADFLNLPENTFAAFAGNDTLFIYKKPLDNPNMQYDKQQITIETILKWDENGQFITVSS